MPFSIEKYEDHTIFWSFPDWCIVKDDVILATTKDTEESDPRKWIDIKILKKEEYDRGFQDGYDAAESAASNFGQDDFDSAFERGRIAGKAEALAQPMKDYEQGFKAGEQSGRAESEHKISELGKKNAELVGKIMQVAFKMPDKPKNCRNRLRDEGKAYPRSGCDYCGTGGMMGCPYERAGEFNHG